MRKKNNIYLIGPMGSGKTTIGRSLAENSGKLFFDSDEEIEKRTGVSVSWIFAIEGESGFRKREKQIIHELTHINNIILATGGGSIIDHENRMELKSNGFVVYLTVSVDIQYERIRQQHGKRPLADTTNPKERLTALNQQRHDLYCSIADLICSTDDWRPQQTVKKILTEFYKYL